VSGEALRHILGVAVAFLAMAALVVVYTAVWIRDVCSAKEREDDAP
jgi:hypothetical protein